MNGTLCGCGRPASHRGVCSARYAVKHASQVQRRRAAALVGVVPPAERTLTPEVVARIIAKVQGLAVRQRPTTTVAARIRAIGRRPEIS